MLFLNTILSVKIRECVRSCCSLTLLQLLYFVLSASNFNVIPVLIKVGGIQPLAELH